MYPWSVLSISISVFKHPVMSFHACALAIGAGDRSFRNTDVYFQELDKGAQSNIWQLVQMMSDDCLFFQCKVALCHAPQVQEKCTLM